MVVVLEDAHLADPDTLGVCALLTRHTGARLMLVVSTRSGYPGTALLEDYLQRLSVRGRASVIDLSPLDEPDADALLVHHLGFTPSTATLRRLGEYAAGNPYFIREIAEQWRTAQRQNDGLGAGATEAIDDWKPSAMARSISHLVRADSPEFNVGAQLSISRAVDPARLAMLPELTGLSEEVVASAVDALAAEEVLVRIDCGSYAFRHDLLREGFLAALGPERLRLLRGRLADALARRRDAGSEVDIYELAELLVGSRVAPDPAVVPILAAAAALAARSAPLVAVNWLRHAREFAGAGAANDEFVQQEVALLSAAGEAQQAWDVADQAVRAITTTEIPVELAANAVAVALSAGEAQEAIRIGERVPRAQRPLIVRAALAAARLMAWDSRTGVPEFEQALLDYRNAPDPHYATALMLYSSARLLVRRTEMTEIGPWIANAIQANDNAHTQLTQVAAWANMAAYGPLGLLDPVNSDPRISDAALATVGWPMASESGVAEQFYLQSRYLHGRWDDVLALVPGIDVISDRGQFVAASTSRIFTAAVYSHRGENAEAARLLDPYADDPLSIIAAPLSTLRARLLAVAGREREAVELLRTVLTRAEQTGILVQISSVSAMLCDLLTKDKQMAEVRELTEVSLARERTLGIPISTGVALVAYGRAHDDTDALLEASEIYVAQDMPFSGAQVLLSLGKLGIDPHANLRTAYEVFSDLRATVLRQQTLAAMHEAGVRVPRRRARDESLSAVEMEVIELVVAGMTNAQIAERLNYSPKTIEMHLTRIYQRTGVRNRVGFVEAVAGGRIPRGFGS